MVFVMYHYVRDFAHSRYRGLKGITTDEFRAQLTWLRQRYRIIGHEDLLEIRAKNGQVPEDAAVLTFDDGYSEHFHTVFPMLHAGGIPALFFPPAQAILERRLLDVNKIHVLLSELSDSSVLIMALESALRQSRQDGLWTFEEYWQTYAQPSRFDTASVIFLKRMLQHALPNPFRSGILNELFESYIGEDETTVANEFYMTVDQLKMMVRCSMYVGSHGYAHQWLDTLSALEQAREVDLSLEFLSTLGVPERDWVMCYPYGATNDNLVSYLKRRGCAFGLTTQVGQAADIQSDPYRLPRMDTNDFPRSVEVLAHPSK
jgi:peptidoglycan/xylan/chitin deacetylase (PgdA/CDA1 family)